ncbi:NTP transferase domain-containing protein [Methanobrevibacter sp. TMH8]|uniref:nucleotidyltransferase family protein n=1 Tax=Methanobrevibacter sp. TMH8 TaxID=2848611 RepID=UPI001CCF7C55|nr:NTP transferase domain-containing protein [Methanobrevibacter sp. TMH8]MBZ9570167.1 NTP transferase domain-containing protein [Methanobrevibacter sp. TMH8]
MLVSCVITAAGRNSRMEKSQIQKGINIKNKLLLPFPTEGSEKTVIETTINNVLSAKVDECIVVLGHFADEIKEVVSNISDSRIKIVENKDINVGLSTSLLNGLNNCTNDFVLCVASDQPTVSTKTYNNIIDVINKANNSNSKTIGPKKTISILRRRNTGILDTAEGLGMPFVANHQQISNYIHGEDDNLNPILRNMFADGFCFYGVKEENDLELININNYDDYNFVLNSLNNK